MAFPGQSRLPWLITNYTTELDFSAKKRLWPLALVQLLSRRHFAELKRHLGD